MFSESEKEKFNYVKSNKTKLTYKQTKSTVCSFMNKNILKELVSSKKKKYIIRPSLYTQSAKSEIG
jgi:hypothetical protein